MAKIYAVSAIVNRPQSDGAIVSVQVPTFYLFADVQGIVDESHAVKIARDMLTSVNPLCAVHAVAVETSVHAHG